MARDLSPVVKQSRREGYALHPKAHKYLVKKQGAPGEQGTGRRRSAASQYSIQLREKQKVRRLYGLLEKQFKNLFATADKMSGKTGENALILLERRLDNAVYRAGFASSRRAARQLVGHGHFNVNGGKVDIPSYRLSAGDKIELRTKSSKNEYFKNIDELSPKPSTVPAWISVDRKKVRIEVASLPTREDAEEDINEQLIVEYYSR